jgi:uncharacterized DUF497 family protein
VRWVWTEAKNRTNKRDHKLSFATAELVFDDPLAVSRHDPHPDGDRWQTLGLVGNVVLFVVHNVARTGRGNRGRHRPHHQRPQGNQT